MRPRQGEYQPNASCVGGGTVSYGAQAWRFMPQDFRMRSTYGTVAGSTLDDWPIGYDDLEPFYEKAEYEIGVSGDVEPNPFKGPRRRPLPMPPLEPKSREYEILKPAALRLGLHPFDTPLLINSVPYDGRSACMRIRWCVGFACETNAKAGSHNTVIPRALATGNAWLRSECTVSEILVDGHGRAAGVVYFDEHDRRQEQPADIVVVSCGATESARLLLLSKSRLFPSGLGNRYDWVGRNLNGHTYTGAVGFFEQETYDDLGPGVCVSVCDYNHGTPGLAGGGMLANEFIRLPFQFSDDQPPGTPSWGKAHKDFMRRYYRRNIMIQGPTQDMPTWDTRVELDPRLKDHWGIPVLRHLGGQAPAHDRDRRPPGREGCGLAQGGGRDPDLRASRFARRLGPPAPVRHLPHGERSQDLGGRRRVPRPRRAQPVRGGRERSRHERRLQPRAHDLRERLSGLRPPGQGLEGRGLAGIGGSPRRRSAVSSSPWAPSPCSVSRRSPSRAATTAVRPARAAGAVTRSARSSTRGRPRRTAR